MSDGGGSVGRAAPAVGPARGGGLAWPRGLGRLSDEALAQRRLALQAHSALLRESIAVQALAWQVGPPGWSLVRGLAAGLRRHPWAPALVAGWLLWRRPRRALRWAWRAWGWWRLGRRVVAGWRRWSRVLSR